MKKLLFIVLAAMMLTGCPQRAPQKPAEVTEVKPPPPMDKTLPPVKGETSRPIDVVPPLPKMTSYDWSGSVYPLIDQMIAATKIEGGNVLLLGKVKNSTNGSLYTAPVTQSLYNALGSSTVFKVIPIAIAESSAKELGLSAEDSLGSRTKVIGLARHVGAQYVLYTTLNGNAKQPQLDMQLMLVNTGELIWSGNDPIHIKE